jgi:G3E family GTPase
MPIYLLTGFLGSGKTSLLNLWLQNQQFSNSAIIINEAGTVGIDHKTISFFNDNVINLITGCLCCRVDGDLIKTLMSIVDISINKKKFDCIIIETSGLSDPGPIIQSLMIPPISDFFYLLKVLTTVDVINGSNNIIKYYESRKQIGLANEIILTKSDLLNEINLKVEKLIIEINPFVKTHISTLFKPYIPSIAADTTMNNIFSPIFINQSRSENWSFINEKIHGESNLSNSLRSSDPQFLNLRKHNFDVQTFALTFERPVIWDKFNFWLNELSLLYGDDLLRIKGILNIDGYDLPILFHSVQRVFHAPIVLPSLKKKLNKSEIVFITKNITKKMVQSNLNINDITTE